MTTTARMAALAVAVFACLAAAVPTARAAQSEETSDECGFYAGAAGAMVLPGGGTAHMRRLGGAALRCGRYLDEFLAIEGEAAWMENAAGLALQGLWHWQGADLYGRFFGYSSFDPFFTFGARGWIGHDIGQVGPKAGIGAFWHLTDEWSLRADADAVLCLDSGTSVAFVLCAGIQYSF